MLTAQQIRERLSSTPIQLVQLDTTGVCNCKCWYCPVAYSGNPKAFRHNITPSEFGHILDQIISCKGTLVEAELRWAWTSHYNETLVHPNWPDLYKELAKRSWHTGTLSNGLAMTPENIRKLEQLTPCPNMSVIINCPSSTPEIWAKLTGKPIALFDRILTNLKALSESATLAPKTTIQVNTIYANDDHVAVGAEAPLSTEELIANGKNTFETWKKLFPNLKITQSGLIDRAGSMPSVLVEKKRSVDPVGCGHTPKEGSRMFGVLHVSATGDCFLCCNDFFLDYRFGNLLEKPLREIWASDAHVEMIQRALAGICRQCSFAL